MTDALICRIQEFIRTNPPPQLAADAMLTTDERRRFGNTPQCLFPVVTSGDVNRAEADIQFGLPPLLKRIYSEVSNGISGFSYEIIGLDGGCRSDLGTVVETYRFFESHTKVEGKNWKKGLLPFCAWGCNIFSCVDCMNPDYKVYTFEDGDAHTQSYDLYGFFERWIDNAEILPEEEDGRVGTVIVNPFTAEKATIYSRKPKNGRKK